MTVHETDDTLEPVRVTPAPAPVVPALPEHALSRPPLRPVPASGSFWRWVGALTLLALAVRVALVDVQSLWLDETLSIQQAGLPLGQLWEFQLTGNVHVPGYHTLLHFWMEAFGTGEVAVRMLSVVLGVAAVPLFAVLARDLFDTRTGVVAAGVGAAAPFWVWHADEARMYPLLLTVGLAGLVLLRAALRHGGVGWWAGYAAALAAGAYSHYFLWLMPPVHLALVLLGRPGRRRLLAWFGATAAGLSVFLPWAYLFVTRRLAAPDGQEFTNYLDGSGDRGLFAALYAVVIFVAVYVVGYHSADVLDVVSGLLVGLWPLAALALVTRRNRPERRHGAMVAFCLGWVAWIVGAGYAIDQVMPGAWYQKYLTMGSVPMLLLLAYGLASTTWRLSRVVPGVVVALLVATLGTNFEGDNLVRQDWRGAVADIRAEQRPGDIVVLTPTLNVPAFMYYWQPGSSGPGVSGQNPPAGIPKVPRGVVPLLSSTNSAQEATTVLLPRLIADHPGSRIWLLRSLDDAYDPQETVPEYLDARLELVERRGYVGDMDLSLYQIPAAAPQAAP